VNEQFDAFLVGFNELIPQDLVNVFDERELELLIGGIADIDVEDWKKHTDYRGYTESDEVIQHFWKVCSLNSCLVLLFLLTCYNSVSAHGILNKSHVCYSMPPVLRVYLSTDSKICKEVTDQGVSRLRKLVKSLTYRRVTLGTFTFFFIVCRIT